MNICEHLTRTARILPGNTALIHQAHRFTYAEVERLSVAAAEQLAAKGLQPGDRASLLLPNVPAFVVWYYAILRLGGVAVSISTRLAPEEAAFVLQDSGTEILITSADHHAAIASVLPSTVRHALVASPAGDQCEGAPLIAGSEFGASWVPTAPDAPALILYTSGTTGFAKGAVLSHQNVRATVLAFNHLCRLTADDRMLISVPLFHCYGQNALLNAGFHAGATLVLQDRFDINESKRLLAEERVTKLFAAPAAFQMLEACCTPADLHWVNYCFSAAATLPIQVGRRWQEKYGMPIFEGYGLTETAPFASYNHRLEFVPGSIGEPVDLVEMKIVDPDTGATLPPNTLGEIAIRGPNVMLGYWNRPEETAAAIRDGWFHSGDLGRCDERGYYYIVDRVKDMISIGGLKVFPAEVERVLHDHPAVSEAAVVGVPAEVFGEKVVAFVTTHAPQPRSETDACDLTAVLRKHCQPHLADYKLPTQYLFVESLPRNPAGKILKRTLRSQFAERSRAGLADVAPLSADTAEASPKRVPAAISVRSLAVPQQPRPSGPSPLQVRLQNTHAAQRQRTVCALIQDEVAQILGEDVRPEAADKFMEVGLDSLGIVDLRDRLQVHVGAQLELPATLVFDYPRICDLAAYLVTALEAGTAQSPPAAPPTPRTPGRLPDKAAAEVAASSVPPPHDTHRDVASLSEDEALAELLRELQE